MADRLHELKLTLTEQELDNLELAVNSEDQHDFRDSWSSDTRKILKAKVVAAIALMKQTTGD